MPKVDYVIIDDERFIEAIRLYFKWKDLNTAIKREVTRGINIPDLISEQITCYAMNLKWNRGTKGDATDENGSLIEIKATSNFNSDLSSFSPNTVFDRLIFFRLNTDNDSVLLYDLGINADSFIKLSVNNTQTVADQQTQKRRPRLSLIKYIEINKIKPKCKVDLISRNIKIY